ncbi:F-box only protein 6 isoform X2 [Mycetomoellerius zeteki]|uniref:F-box only protein 6 isoform X2 n=1 Tax=Mycetomoellerius zeteki TaxID=64791 RepID=UPI00084E8F8E|nr:PREDICTED: F-box only protein 6-like isoform X2 [Trachymyrmex zeteki]
MMEQFNATPSNFHVEFDEENDDGLILCDKFLPVEMLMKIFAHIDCKTTIMNCLLVCKRWKTLMTYVWYKKTKQTLMDKSILWNNEVPWSIYYIACSKKLFERNLIRNHSGAIGICKWEIPTKKIGLNNVQLFRSLILVEKLPDSVPELPQTEPLFRDTQTCFNFCLFEKGEIPSKEQYIHLEYEGISPYILDTYQPPIMVSDWYCCPTGDPIIYKLNVSLYGERGPNNVHSLIKCLKFQDIVEGERQNQWLQISHEFRNYGTGVRSICFEHKAGQYRDIKWKEGFNDNTFKVAGAYAAL